MLPYLHAPTIAGHAVPWFALLVGLGIFVGFRLVRWRAPACGVTLSTLDTLLPTIMVTSFVTSHLVHALVYEPRATLAAPLDLLAVWRGHSSMGGFLGTLLGALAWRRWIAPGTPLLPLADLVMSVFPISWTFGRAGCALIHDHISPRVAAPNALTVAFPDGPRYDLGLLEMLAAALIAVVVVSLWRRPRRVGTYTGLGMVLYAPVRFGLDSLRVRTGAAGDATYLGLTPGQWGSGVLLAVGLWLLSRRVAPAPGR